MLDLFWTIKPEALAQWILSEEHTFEERIRAAAAIACTCKAGRDFHANFLLHR